MTEPQPTRPVERYVFNRYHGDAPPGSVYIGRGSPHGNQFVIGDKAEGKHGTRDEVVAAHRAWFLSNRTALLAVRCDLAGRTMICFCYPKACHGDVYAEVANMPTIEFQRLITAARARPEVQEWPDDGTGGWPTSG